VPTVGRLGLSIVAAGFLLLPAAAAASAEAELPPGLGIRQLDVEPQREDGGRSARYVTDHVEPGDVVERRVRVSNGTDETMTVQLYAADADVEGGWSVADGRGTGELAGWIEVTPDRLTLEPGERQAADFRIAVPEDAGGGERYAAIVAEAPPVGQDVRVIPRVGVRVYLSVGGPQAPASDFEIDGLRPGRTETGAPVVLIDVENTGGRAIDLQGDLELTDGPGGLRAGPFPVASQTTVGPGLTGEVPVVFDPDLPQGPWRAVARLSAGDLERQAEAQITFPEHVGISEAVEADPLQDRGVLIPLAAGLLLLALLLLLLVALRRRRSDDEDDDGSSSNGGEPHRCLVR
jgi:hypothetical protein